VIKQALYALTLLAAVAAMPAAVAAMPAVVAAMPAVVALAQAPGTVVIVAMVVSKMLRDYFVNKQKYILFFVLVALLVVGVLYYVSLPIRNADVLIRGVPYIGNFSGTILRNAPESIAAMITRYWGDERLSEQAIREELQNIGIGENATVTMTDLASFFARQGYETKVERFQSVDDLFKYLNQNIPLIFALKLPTDRYVLIDHSVLIGILSGRRTVVLHSNLLGNNYEMSFDEFTRSWSGRERDQVVLIVRPSQELRETITQPEHSKDYPPRLGIMDDPGLQELRFKMKWVEEIILTGTSNGVSLREEVVNDPEFDKLRPTGKIWAYLGLAREYMKLGEIDRAIAVVKEKAMPLNHDIEKAFGEWPAFQKLPSGAEWNRPWIALVDLYLMKDDVKKARAALDKAIEIDPEDQATKERVRRLENR